MIHGNINGRAAATGGLLSREGELASADVSNWPPDLSSSSFPPSAAAAEVEAAAAAAASDNPLVIMADCLNCFLWR